MAKKGKVRPPIRKPKGLAVLHAVVEHLRADLEEYRAHKPPVDYPSTPIGLPMCRSGGLSLR